MTSSISNSSRASRALALAGPMLVLGLAVWLLWPAPWSGGGVVAPPVGSLTDDCSTAQVLLLGNSKTRSDLNPSELEAFLGLAPGSVTALTLHGSNAPVWYAILQNMAYARGCRPRLVVVYGTLDKLLAADVSPDERVRLLAPVLSGDEPVLTAKLRGVGAAPTGAWLRARRAVVERREALLENVAALCVGTVFPGAAHGTRLEIGRAALDAASDAVFTKSGIESGGTVVGPLPTTPAPLPGGARQPVSASDTFLAELAALAQAHGSTLVFVRAPMPNETRERAILAIRGLRGGAVTLANERGAAFLDLGDQRLPVSAFLDGDHMNAMASTRNTWALARRLEQLGAAQGGEITGRLDATAVTETPVVLWPLETRPRFAAPPLPQIRASGLTRTRGKAAELRLAPELDFGDHLCRQHEVYKCCSPLVVSLDGQRLPEPNALPNEVEALGGGRYVHQGATVLVSSPTGTEPPRKLQSMGVTLDPSRWCGSLWLYPGDEALFTGMEAVGRRPSLSLGQLELLVTPFGDGGGELRVSLEVDGTSLAATAIDLQEQPGGLRSLTLERPLRPGEGPLSLRLSMSDGAPYLLIKHLALVP